MGLFRRKPKTPTPPPAPRVEAAPPTTAMSIIRGDLEAELAAEIDTESSPPPSDARG